MPEAAIYEDSDLQSGEDEVSADARADGQGRKVNPVAKSRSVN
jgi:hypothetical protein